ncbi:choice-of-anchor L domain-containing protein, partial [Flavobacterium lacus]
MKKITLLVLLYILSGTFSYAQENFEGGIPSGWAVYNNSFGNNLWTTVSTVTTPPTVCEGAISAFVNGRENIGVGNTSEKWLVSNQITVPQNGQLLFAARSTINGFDNTTYQIRVSTVSQTSGFSIVAQWTEAELNTIFNICEEKTVDLGAAGYAGQDIYIAFVMLVNQPTTTPTGDRWILDDIRVVERCIDPTDIQVGGISLNGATVTWNNPGGANQFEVEIVASPGAPTGTGVIVNGTSFNATGLSPTTQYQVYVRAVCDESNSEWIGPVNFATTSPGRTCNAPIQITSLPYSTTDNTSGYGDDIGGSPGAGCGSTSGYLDGDDVFYSFTAQNNGVVNITMTPTGTWSGLFVYNSCANVGVSCIAGVASSDQTPRVIDLPVTAGQTYFIVISTFPAPQSVAYTLTLQVVNCPPPAALVAANIGQTSAQLSWSNPSGATAWEVAVQPAGSAIPAGSGEPANTNSNFLVSGLTQATAYQYYVRAACGDGTFSVWSGPFLFNTTICEPSEQCTYTFRLTDSFGDGWNGATMLVRQNGITVATLGPTFTTGAGPINISVPLCNNLPFDLLWQNGGGFPGEVRVSIINPAPFNQTLYALTTSSPGLVGSVLYSGTVDCFNPACLPPSGVTMSNIGDTSATVTWTPITGVTQYEVIVLPAGSPAPTAASTGEVVTGNSFEITGLTSATLYNVYVRAICGSPIPSNWTPATVFNTTICQVANQCLYSFVMTDSFGDGWNGNTMNVTQNGIVVGVIGPTFTAGGGPVTVTVPLCDNLPFQLFWNTGGAFAFEVGVEIIDPFGEQLYIKLPGEGTQGTTLYSGFVSCTPPSCPKPNTLAASALTQTGATLTWNEIGTATSWEVIILPAGSPAPLPTDSGIIVTTPSYIVTNLSPGTSYVFYVRAICAEDDLSNWAGPRAFVTLIANDECDNAIPVPVNPDTNCGQVVGGTVLGATASAQPNTCFGTDDDDVWFEFVAETATHSINLINVSGSTTDLFHVLYQGDECGSLTQLYCSDADQSVATNLTPGQTYKIRVYTWTATPNQTTTFSVCVGTIPPPITTNTTQYTVPQLVQDILINSTCALVSNITWSTGSNFGSTNGIGYFEQNGSTFPFDNGIVMTTGDAARAAGPNVNLLGDGNQAWVGDTDLEAIILAATGDPMNSRNASVIEFDFVPLTDFISFDFIFASEEYGTFQCTFSDAFAFLLTDLSTNVTTNLAVIPNTNIPISVVTIRDQAHNDDCNSVNPEFFDNFYELPTGLNPLGAPTDFNGITIPMIASSAVVPNNTYRIKLVIADRQDNSYDSAVFLKGGSFNIGDIELGDDFLVASGNALCPGDTTVIDSGLSPETFTFQWLLGEDVIADETGPSLVVAEPGTYTLIAQYTNTNCSTSDSIVIEYFDNFVTGEPNDLYFCSASGFGTFDLTQNDEPLTAPLGINYVIGYYLTEEDATLNLNVIANPTAFNNTTNPQTIYVRVSPANGDCFALNNFQLIVEDLTPQFDLTPDFSICEGASGTIEVTPINYEEGSVTYTWTVDTNPLPDTTSAITVTTAGVYEVTVDFGGCANTASTTVTVIPFVDIQPIEDVGACGSYELPALLVGNYYTQTNGAGDQFTPGTEIIETTTLFVYVENEGCSDEESFTITINNVVVDVFEDQTVCESYTLQALSANNAYFTQPDGLGTELFPEDNIVATTTIYVYASSGTEPNCVAQSSFTITVSSEILPAFDPIVVCQNADAPVLPATSLEGVTGTWNGVVDTSVAGEFVFTFTPNETFECAIATTLTVVVNPTVVATFDAITTTYCQGATPDALPVSNNAVPGTWSP